MTSEEEPLHWSLFSSDDDDDYANDNGEEESLDRSGDTNTSSVDVLTVSSPSSHSESPTWNSFSEEDDPHFVPLLHTWIWWYHKPNRQSRGPWSENLHRVTMIDDAVTFWHFYHNLKRPSELPVGADYFIFKADLTPKWETPENARGGRVAVSFNRSNVSSQQVLSGQLEFLCSYINGIFVSVRSKGYKVGLWLHSDSNDDDKKQFREVFKILVGKEHPAFYKPHIKVLR
ncbi:eukaryotic initiation factor 4E [Trichuris suis]|nr:eukaryotic initiation factor 4E [Trichuris suis]